jgi:hypothetical protein
MRHPSANPRGTPRLTTVLVLLAAILGSLVATLIPTPTPAGAVPVDGTYSGRITNTAPAGTTSTGTSTDISITLATSSPNRTPVSVSVSLGTGLFVECAGRQAVAATGSTPMTFTTTSGGVASAAAPGTSRFISTFTPMGSPFAITIDATVSQDRGRVFGTVTPDLPSGFPLSCIDPTLSFDTFADRPYRIRTGHDGMSFFDPSGAEIDLTHMIDRNQPGTPENGKRCMFLWADPGVGAPSTPPTAATWSVESGAPAGAGIEPGWAQGDPTGLPPGTFNPFRTRVCINDSTPLDTTFVVRFAPTGNVAPSRVVLWVGSYRNYPGRAQGDVHNVTFDETRYDFQGVGEYVDAVAGSGQDFAVQSRLEQVPGAPVTVTTAIAARVNGDRIGLYLDAKGIPQWYLDGKPIAVPTTLPAGGEITNPAPDRWRVTWPRTGKGPGSTSGTTMQVSFARWSPKDHLNIDELLLGDGLGGGQVSGLLGIADRDPANDLTPSTGGDPVSPDIDPSRPAFEQPLYREFGRSWLVSAKGPNQSLFDYLDPGHPDSTSYENEQFPAERPGVVDRKARAVCERSGVTAWPQIDFCTYDIEVTGAREIAAYYRDGWLPA